MDADLFRTTAGTSVTAVTADGMRDVDRVAVEEIGLTLPRMMEHAGRSLAAEALAMRGDDARETVVLAGGGGNGGGGLVCARNLLNRDVPTTVVLDRAPGELDGVPGEQLSILQEMGVAVRTEVPPDASLVVDAILGYGLTGAPHGRAADLIEWTDSVDAPILSLDVPSGIDATTGERPGLTVHAARTLTLALPKTGLAELSGDLVLADLSIPTVVYDRLDIPYESPFGKRFVVDLLADR
jgi:NAD(P)H-hydrate epimerase